MWTISASESEEAEGAEMAEMAAAAAAAWGASRPVPRRGGRPRPPAPGGLRRTLHFGPVGLAMLAKSGRDEDVMGGVGCTRVR